MLYLSLHQCNYRFIAQVIATELLKLMILKYTRENLTHRRRNIGGTMGQQGPGTEVIFGGGGGGRITFASQKYVLVDISLLVTWLKHATSAQFY